MIAPAIRRLSAVLSDRECPVCGGWYDPSDSDESHPHNNHPPEAPHA